MFLHVQIIQTSSVDNLCFFLPNVHHSFWKLMILTLIIKREKGLELMKFIFKFEHIWFRSVFDLKKYGFKKCAFNKSCSCLCDRGH